MKTLLKPLTVGCVAMILACGLTAEAAAKRKSTKTVTGVINLNSATSAQLDQLPGVGVKAAERIIAHRAKTPFTRPEELVKVKGFGKKKVEKIKAHLAVSGPTTLKVANASVPDATHSPPVQGRSSPAK